MPVQETLSKAEAGRLGARTRWGPRRVVRLDTLEPPIAAAVRALIAADEAARKRKPADVSETPSAGRAEVQGDARSAA